MTQYFFLRIYTRETKKSVHKELFGSHFPKSPKLQTMQMSKLWYSYIKKYSQIIKSENRVWRIALAAKTVVSCAEDLGSFPRIHKSENLSKFTKCIQKLTIHCIRFCCITLYDIILCYTTLYNNMLFVFIVLWMLNNYSTTEPHPNPLALHHGVIF